MSQHKPSVRYEHKGNTSEEDKFPAITIRKRRHDQAGSGPSHEESAANQSDMLLVFANQIQLLNPIVQAGLVIPVDVVVRDLWRSLALANLFIRTRIETTLIIWALEVRHQFIVTETIFQKAKRHHAHDDGDSN